jgi:putative endonuclease
MPTTKEIGDYFELKAKEIYIKNGYECLAENYRYRRREIDLIFKKNELLIFVEVKYRKSATFGFPEDWVDQRKQNLLEECADFFIEEYNWFGNIRFDIAAYLKKENKAELKIFSDVF